MAHPPSSALSGPICLPGHPSRPRSGMLVIPAGTGVGPVPPPWLGCLTPLDGSPGGTLEDPGRTLEDPGRPWRTLGGPLEDPGGPWEDPGGPWEDPWRTLEDLWKTPGGPREDPGRTLDAHKLVSVVRHATRESRDAQGCHPGYARGGSCLQKGPKVAKSGQNGSKPSKVVKLASNPVGKSLGSPKLPFCL